jgi:hypothetical protein
VSELEAGIETTDSYTVENAVRDWLARGTKHCPRRRSTITRALRNPT